MARLAKLFLLISVLSVAAQVNFAPFVRPRSGQSTLLNGLVAFWKLDETSGTRYDSHINGYHLQPSGTVKYTNGVVGYALDVSAVGGRLTNVYGNELNPSSFSVAFWFYVTNTSRFFLYNGEVAGTFTNNYYFNQAGTNQISMIMSNAAAKTFTLTNVTFKIWHVVYCYDGSDNTVTLYNDGVLKSKSTAFAITKPTLNPSVFYLGGRNTATSCDGWMDEVGFWNRVLTSNEVASVYSANTNGVTYPFTGY